MTPKYPRGQELVMPRLTTRSDSKCRGLEEHPLDDTVMSPEHVCAEALVHIKHHHGAVCTSGRHERAYRQRRKGMGFSRVVSGGGRAMPA
eukprot:scaffold92551_cov32-Tisochrysis_lutea.AAC.2